MQNRSHFTAPFLINTQLLEGIAAKVMKDFDAKQKEKGIVTNTSNSTTKVGSQLMAKKVPGSSSSAATREADREREQERPWDRAGVGAGKLTNQQKQQQLSQSCFKTEDDLNVTTAIGSGNGGSAGAGQQGTKELDSLRKVVLGEKGRPAKELREEELREQKARQLAKKVSADEENSKLFAVASRQSAAKAVVEMASGNDDTATNEGDAGSSPKQPVVANNNNAPRGPGGFKTTPSLLEEMQAKKKKSKNKGGAAPNAAPVRERVVEMAEGIDDYEEDDRMVKKTRAE